MKRDDEDTELIALDELRRRFEAEYETAANDDGSAAAKVVNNHHNRTPKAQQSDMHRLKTQNWWPLTFLHRYDLDVDVAFPALVECLKWRLHFDIDHLSILELKPLLDRQVMYIHGVNVDYQSILWFNVRHHKKGDMATQKLVVYWLERHAMETQSRPLVIVFDMTNAGLQNMDFDLVKFLLHCLKYYYPQTLAYLLVYDIPFILNAAWKLIKSWLDPAAQKMIIFVGKTSIQQYIAVDSLPKHMGGNDEFTFTMDELARCIGDGTPITPPSTSSRIVVNQLSLDDDPFPKRRNVKFSSTIMETDPNGALPTDADVNRTPSMTRRGEQSRQQQLSVSIRHMVDKRLDEPASAWFIGAFLSVSPKEELVLRSVAGESERVEVVILRNTGKKNAIFKIKTTSPEKFRVRPSTGVIAAGELFIVRLYVQSEYVDTVEREKFLIMAVETDVVDVSNDLFSSIWSDAVANTVHFEHRLRCRLGIDGLPKSSTSITTLSSSTASIIGNDSPQQLSTAIRRLQIEMRLLTLLVLFVVIILAVSFARQSSSQSTTLASLVTLCKQQQHTDQP